MYSVGHNSNFIALKATSFGHNGIIRPVLLKT